GSVGAARGEGAAVGAERHARHHLAEATAWKPFLACLSVVGPDPGFRGPLVRDKHRPAVWAEVEKDGAAGGGGPLGGFLLGGRLPIPALKAWGLPIRQFVRGGQKLALVRGERNHPLPRSRQDVQLVVGVGGPDNHLVVIARGQQVTLPAPRHGREGLAVG